MDQANTLKFDADHAEEFLTALGKNPTTTRIRAFYEKDDSRKNGDRGIKCDFSPEQIQKLINDGRGVYVVINEGGDTDKSITQGNALFCEWDDMPKERQKTEWQPLGLPEPTVQNDSGGRSIHNYWVFAEPIAHHQIRQLQTRLAALAGSDTTLKNESRVMRLPGGYRGDGAREPVRIISNTGRRYTFEQLDKLLPPLARVEEEKKATRQNYSSRSMDEVRAALNTIPPRLPGTGTYPQYRNILWGLIKAVLEAGGTRDEAIALMKQHSPAWEGVEQIADSGGGGIKAATFWYYAQKNGYQLKQSSTQHQDPPRNEVRQRTYCELIDALLDETVRGRPDQAMPLRAELITKFRVTGSQVEQALFKRQMQREAGGKSKSPPQSLDLSAITGMDYLIDGFIIENDQVMLWGGAGTGKTTVGIGIADSHINAKAFLDHSNPPKSGAVLFIASDSGPAPLKATIQDFGLDQKPEFNEGTKKRFHVWASDQNQGMNAWSADLQGCMRLLHFVKEFDISLVIIDSCKAVLAGTDIEYTDNRGVTALMTFFKEVICPHTTVVWLNHDGAVSRGPGCPAGAKAWKEIPSIVHHLTVPIDPETKKPVKNHRQWLVEKNRLGITREFLYSFADGELSVLHGQTTHGNCLIELVDFMSEGFLRNEQRFWKTRDLYEACKQHSAKTVANTLTTATKAKHPEICRKGRGTYALAPRILETLIKARSQSGGSSSHPSPEQAFSDFPSTSQPPESGSSPECTALPERDRREDVGKKVNPCHANESDGTSSQSSPHVKAPKADEWGGFAAAKEVN